MSQTKGFRTANKRYMMIFVPMMAIYCVAITAALTLIDFDTAPTQFGFQGVAVLFRAQHPEHGEDQRPAPQLQSQRLDDIRRNRHPRMVSRALYTVRHTVYSA